MGEGLSRLALDHLDLLRQAPTMVHVWHLLFRETHRLALAQQHEAVRLVRAMPQQAGMAALYATTFSHAISGHYADLAAAARVVRAGGLPADAAQALANIDFATGLARGGTGDGFVQALIDIDLPGLLDFMGQAVQRQVPALPVTPAGVMLRKVAVVAPSLSTQLHAPTDMALAHVRELVRAGLEVALFSPQEFRMPDMPHWLGMPRGMRLGQVPRGGWEGLPKGVRAVISNEALSMMARWTSLLAHLRQWGPDAVLFVGPFSAMLQALYRDYPLVGLGTNTVAPIGPLDLWLAPRAGMPPTWAPRMPVGQVRHHGRRIDVPPAERIRERSQLQLPEGAVAWLTTGTRLGVEVSGAWLELVLAELERQPHCHWLLVGKTHEDIKALDGHPRVHRVDYDPALGEIMRVCDLYLNPPRMGGGFSVAMAMAHGLPALATAGSDGGEKVGPDAMADLAQYGQALAALSADAAQRRGFGERMRQRYAREYDIRAGAGERRAALEAAVALADKRRSRPPAV